MLFSQDNPLFILLNDVNQFDYPVYSRIHPLRLIPNCYVKREDELGFGISGSKIRKYRTLIPFFKQQKFKEVVIIGGANSNHVLGITELLIENGIKPHLFLLGDKSKLYESNLGNLFFLKLLINLDSVRWVSRVEWANVFSIAKDEHPEVFILEEGGSSPQALAGLLTLALDIKRNEEMSGFEFEHIFIDAGTGITAISLILGFAFLKKQTKIHVLLLADNEEVFLEKLKQSHDGFEKMFRIECPFPVNFHLHKPRNAKSFGSTNRKVFDEIQVIARQEGFFTDPVYSAKLFLEAKRIIKEESIEEKALIIHSGGALTLTGFYKDISF
jgi:1-aminocyclopropane-1-carboxylate deaminase/D-cysteine desulfhydrase-like pyridoxal-dependent ACC family enzyme